MSRRRILEGAGRGMAYYDNDNMRGYIFQFIDYLPAADRAVVLRAMGRVP